MASMADISVLIVDDHMLFADALQERLAREPDLRPISVAYNARDAIDQAAETRPAVVIIDVVLDGYRGLDLVEKMLQTSPDSKVVVLTVAESVDDVVAALARGARAWLPKTIDVNHLLRVIRGVECGEAWLAPELLGRVLTDFAAARRNRGQSTYRALVRARCGRPRSTGG